MPSTGASWQQSRQAGADGCWDTLMPIHALASPRTKPCSSRQGKLGKSGHKVALCWALCLKGSFLGGQKVLQGWHPVGTVPPPSPR